MVRKITQWVPIEGTRWRNEVVLSATANEAPMTHTINTGTMLIEEGSLRFEGEPWTSFYMAGEMIRELRNASENKASTGAKATSGNQNVAVRAVPATVTTTV